MQPEVCRTIKARLLALQDEKYRVFQCRLMPTVPSETVIGVRTPQLRALAREWNHHPEIEPFLQTLPHETYEENNLHAFFIEQIRDFDRCIAALNAFLPYVDNWATCDSMRPKVLCRYPEALLAQIRLWLADPHPYTVRYGIGMLMTHFLDARFDPFFPELVASVQRTEYYVQMMMAWYFATALAKQWDCVLPYILQNRLPEWVHNKTIQKAVESYRIPPQRRAYLRQWKRNGASGTTT